MPCALFFRLPLRCLPGKEIGLQDAFENRGARLVREVASNTADREGDGTTTVNEPARAIHAAGIENITGGGECLMIDVQGKR